MSTKQKPGRKPEAPITSDDQLGSLKAVALYLRVGETWLGGVKRRQLEIERMKWLEGEAPPIPAPAFACNKTCARWVKEFIRHPFNAGFTPTASYRKERP